MLLSAKALVEAPSHEALEGWPGPRLGWQRPAELGPKPELAHQPGAQLCEMPSARCQESENVWPHAQHADLGAIRCRASFQAAPSSQSPGNPLARADPSSVKTTFPLQTARNGLHSKLHRQRRCDGRSSPTAHGGAAAAQPPSPGTPQHMSLQHLGSTFPG